MIFYLKKAAIDLIEFNKTIILLERKRYIEECTNPNQRNTSLRSWKITTEGAISFNDLKNGQGILGLIKSTKTTQYITIGVSFITILVVVAQYFASLNQNQLVREQNIILNKEYNLHLEEFKRQNVKIDSLKGNN